MATYEDIYGKRVKDFDSDPTLTSSYEGQVWYNSGSGTLKSVVAFDAWSSSSSVITARYGTSGAGTQTAGLMFAGNSSSTADTYITNTEEYNGSGWATGGALPTGTRSGAGFGTQTAALLAGGYDGSNTAEAYTYNGTSWTGIPALNTARRSLDNMGAGTTTAAIVAGGYVEPPYLNSSEEYNGSSWSEGNNLNTARANAMAAGIQTASFIAGGQVPPESAATENYDGTSWTSSGNLNTARRLLGGGGSQTNGIVFGGYAPPGNQNLVENYDGTSWTANPATLAQARHGGASGSQPGAASSTFYASGYSPASPVLTTNTEEYNNSINTITAAAWSSGGAIPSAAMRSGAGTGTQTAGLLAAGYTNTIVAESYEYDGSSWTATNDLPAVRYNIVGVGTQTASLLSGGIAPPSNTLYAETFTYNGSTFSDTGYDLPGARSAGGMFGTQTAAVYAAGSSSVGPANAVTNSYEYDGEGWTAGNSISTARNNLAGFGTQTAGAICNGYIPGGGGYSSATEEYDGTNWSTGGTMVVGSSGCRASGSSQTDAIVFSGRSSANNGEQRTFAYDGAAWASQPSMGNNHYQQAQAGTSSTTTWIAGGGPKGSGTPDNVTNTEEFTPVTETVTASTLTTS